MRGVNCDYALQALLKNNLIEIVGRKDAIGKPLLFGTSETFLKRFGIDSVEDLPERDKILDKIKEIEAAAPEPTEEELYNFAKQEENPEFLQGEDVVMIDADGETAVATEAQAAPAEADSDGE